MKRVERFILLCAAFVLFASPALAAVTVTDFASLQSAMATGGEIIIGANITVTAALSSDKAVQIKGSKYTLTRDSSFNNAPMITCKGANSTFDDIVFDGNNVDTTISTEKQGGGGLLINGVAATVTNCTFKNHKIKSAQSYSGGGGLYTYNANGSKIENCTFEKNTVIHTTKNKDGGGNGMLNIADKSAVSITITGCKFTENKSTKPNIGSSESGYIYSRLVGGGMCNFALENTLTINIDNCEFNQNLIPRYGGGIYNGTEDGKAKVVAKITNSTFTGNELSGQQNNGSFGGGIANYAAQGEVTVTIENCSFKNNKATNDKWQKNYFGSLGGGLVSLNFGYPGTITTTVTNCYFEGNEANNGGAIANWSDEKEKPATMTISNCTFVNNKSVTSNLYSKNGDNSNSTKGYPRGGGVFNWASTNLGATDNQGTATMTITNSTFTGNTAENYGGGMANFNTGKAATLTAFNCTFISNNYTGTTATSTGGTEFHNEGGTANFTNTIFYNNTSGKYPVVNSAASGVTLPNCAHNNAVVGTGVTVGATNKANITPINATKSTTVKINNVDHTVFKLASEDVNLVRGGASASGVPAKDVLGMARNASAPSIGAVEYVTFAVSMDQALPDGTIGTAYIQPLQAVFLPAQSGAVLAWSLNSGSALPDGLTLASGVISGEPTKVGDYSFTINVKGSEDIYADYSASQAFTLKINEKPVVSLDLGTITITSEGGIDNLDLELTSVDYAAAAETSADLKDIKTGVLNVASSDQADVLITINVASADIDAVLCDSDDITSDLEKGTETYSLKPEAAGAYKIIFKGANDDNIAKYFAAGFTYNISDDSGLRIVTELQDANANEDGILDAAQRILNDYMNGSTPNAEAILNFFESVEYHQEPIYGAEALASLDIPSLEGLKGEEDFGNAENGFKIVAMQVPQGVTLAAGLKFFVIMLDDTVTPSVYRVGIAAVPASDAGASHLVIKFRNLKDTQNTTYYLSYPNGTYNVGATTSSESDDVSSTRAAAIFFKADDGKTFAMALSEPVKLRGQTSAGRDVAAPAKNDYPTSSHGGSGCDTGLSGAAFLALAAFAIAKKIKK